MQAGIPFPRNFNIGPVHIAPATVLAPMAGVTDTVFRRLIRNQGGCGLIMTEFTSSHGVVGNDGGRKATKKAQKFDYLAFEPEEHPITAQLFGADKEVMAEAARICQDMGFNAIDINFGCPVKKVVRCNGGSGCLRDLPLVRDIVSSVKNALNSSGTTRPRAARAPSRSIGALSARRAHPSSSVLPGPVSKPRTGAPGCAGRAVRLAMPPMFTTTRSLSRLRNTAS